MYELSKELTYKVNSDKEYKDFLKFIESKGFPVDSGLFYSDPNWCHVAWKNDVFLLRPTGKVTSKIIDCKKVIGFGKPTELTELPKKWYIKATVENRDALKEWRGGSYTSWSENLLMISSKIWRNDEIQVIKEGYKEITFEQFKKWVLKELSMKEIQEECKKRFPIKCTFINTEGEEHVLIDDEYVYEIAGNAIWASKGLGLLYDGGKYATLVKTSEVVKTKFEKGDYIVILSGRKNLDHIADDYCYKQSTDSFNLETNTDKKGGYYDAADVRFDNTVDKWRYATPEEIAEYNRIGSKPYDVTTLKSKPKFEVGKWYKGEANNKYIKFSSIEKRNGYNRVNYNEKIYNSKHEIISNYWASDDLEHFALNNPVDISEIQQYLPDGHPDKFVNKSDIQVTNNILYTKTISKQTINVQVYPETKINIPLNKDTKKSKIIQITI